MENTKTKRLSTKSMVLCAMFTALVAVGAFIQIPVPYMDYFTLQFFFVLLAGLILGGNKGAISVGCYVLLGLIGIPIFAAGGGIGYIFRPSFGYLVGFIASAFVTGKICEKLKASYKNYLLACLAGFVVTYAIGIVYKFIILNFYRVIVEISENLIRSRRCNGIVVFYNITVKMGRFNTMLFKPKSEDLPKDEFYT